MEKSTYENLNNAQLFFLIKLFIKNLDGDSPDITEEHTFDVLESAASSVGLRCKYIIDLNYVMSVLEINPNYDFESKSPSGILNRPKAGLYDFDYDEDRREYYTTTYENSIISYDEDLVIDTIMLSVSSGELDIYNGMELDREYYDGETYDVSLDSRSIRKIK
jgi:hypothetical protein